MELRLPDGRRLVLDRPRIVGILNITPDSFSDGGRHASVDAAVAHAGRMLSEGADVLDIGGESTRPGAARIDAAEQIARVTPVIRQIARTASATGPPIVSIDTTRAAVARAALDEGATILNDVSAGRDDPGMFELAAQHGAPIILMHMQGEPATMQLSPRYEDVVREVRDFLLQRAAAAEAAGVPRSQVVLDPGIGFGKTLEHNLALLASLKDLVATGYAVMLGASRKRFLGVLAGGRAADDAGHRLGGTAACTALGVAAGVHLFRVHDVTDNRQAALVAQAVHTGSAVPACGNFVRYPSG
jgi:dihydropteroate synthase